MSPGVIEECGTQEMSAWGDLPIAPVVGMWAEACFPVESKTTESEVNKLLEEAAEAAREDYDAASAVAWADGYEFPSEYMAIQRKTTLERPYPFPELSIPRITDPQSMYADIFTANSMQFLITITKPLDHLLCTMIDNRETST